MAAILHFKPITAKIDVNPRPGSSKLTISLVNVSLEFERLISNICQYFC